MLNPSEIKAPPTADQLYAIVGELTVENRMLKAIIAQHPEVVAAHNADPPAASMSGFADMVPESVRGEVVPPGETGEE